MKKFLFAACVALPALAGVSHAYELPTLSDAKAQQMINRFSQEVATLENEAYLAEPAAKEWPCAVGEADLRQIAGIPDPAQEEETRKATVKMFREQGMSPDAIPKSTRQNVRVVPISAQCRDGKLDGEVDVWSTQTLLTDMQTQSSTMTMTSRSVRHYAAGKLVGEVRTVLRHGDNVTQYKDPAMAKMMAKAQANANATRNFTVSYSLAEPDAGMASFTLMPAFKPKGGFSTKLDVSYSIMSMLMIPAGKGRLTVLAFNGAQPSSMSHMKDGKPHGESVTYAVTGDKGQVIVPENHTCFQNGQQVQTITCPND